MPVCSNCGGSDFVWAENLRTGTIGRGTLSLRSGGQLPLGTRICRGCGHADLFVKDPTILRQPHTWRPGEFVAIPPRTPVEARPPAPAPSPPPVLATRPPNPPPPGPAATEPRSAPSPAAPAPPAPAPTAAPSSSTPVAPTAPAAAAASAPSAPEAEPSGERKRPSRRKGTKAKPPSPTILQE
jgi:hypothetical protein